MTDRRVSRRGLLVGGAGLGIGAAAAAGVAGLVAGGGPPPEATPTALNGERTVPFHGRHQAGVTVAPPAHVSYAAVDLDPATDRAGLARLMRLLTDDAARLTQGRGPLADDEPELAGAPAGLTVTFGVGPGFVARAGAAAPAWLRPLPAFSVDRLDPAYCGGDLLIAVASDDPLTVVHATRMLLKDVRTFGSLRWQQTGFRRAAGSETPGSTMRNLFGQLDGTANPRPEDPDFASSLWCTAEPRWLAGGTSFVLRRIRMDLDGWDRLDRPSREQALGRTLRTGAPLTGSRETDDPDLQAVDAHGFPVIPAFAHVRRARSGREQIHRRGYTFTEPAGAAGLLFGSYQADVDAQFVPIQRRLDELDLLNRWTTPVGSAVFAIPPGWAPGGFVGETLLG
ncbi:Dyp-type peroxidase [Leifsonia sp. NPDC080035]|uniref:Dyp-type peroxidase n=1 Tax=Leifsonia sp. NPDC080035 TaxID=3143936 RepID=A0AAU7GIM4_9MICO